jgi:hypothetical protein
MTHLTGLVAAGGMILFTFVTPPAGQAQDNGTLLPDGLAVEATVAAVKYMLTDVDSLVTVGWPSAKTLLARRPGIIALSGISTRFDEDPAAAIALTEHVAEALNFQGITARVVPRNEASHCGIGITGGCSLPEDVGLSLFIGYPSGSESSFVTRITMVADSRIRAGRPVVSLEIVVQRDNGTWIVTSVERTRVLSE